MSGISFFHPAYLWALFALLIPLIIHFIRRKHTVTLDFSSIRFFKQTAVKASRIRRIKNILQLINRILLLLFLLLIFAQPFNRDDPFRVMSGSNTALYCWIDPTISMGYKTGDASLWQEACRLSAQFDTVLHSAAAFYCYDGRIQDFVKVNNPDLASKGKADTTALSGGVVIKPSAPTQYYPARAGRRDNVYERFTPIRHGPGDFGVMMKKFDEYKNAERRTPVLVLLSDFQEKDRSEYEELLVNSRISFPVIGVVMQDQEPWNYSVYNPLVSLEENPSLQCIVAAQGRNLDASAVVVLIENMRVGQQNAAVKKDSAVSMSVAISAHGGQTNGEARLIAPDPYDFDNVTYFVERKATRRRVLVIAEGGESSYPVAAAFSSLVSSPWYPPVVKHPMDVSYDDLDSSDIIVLCSVAEPAAVFSALWSRGALNPKTIVFSPDLDKSSGSLNSIVFKHLGADVTNERISTEKPGFPVLPDTVSSVWRGFPRFTDKDVSVYSFYSNIPGNALVRLNNGMPLVSHAIDSSEHSWILFASPVTVTEANNLCETGFYVPLLDRSVRYAGAFINKEIGIWTAGIARQNPFYGSRVSAQVFNSDNTRIDLWERQPKVSLELPGIYRVNPSGQPPYWIAAVADSAEGRFMYRTPSVSESNRRYVRFMSRSSLRRFIQNHSAPGYEFLWVLLGVCLIFEVLLWKKQKT